jgi:hypothetical protein
MESEYGRVGEKHTSRESDHCVVEAILAGATPSNRYTGEGIPWPPGCSQALFGAACRAGRRVHLFAVDRGECEAAVWDRNLAALEVAAWPVARSTADDHRAVREELRAWLGVARNFDRESGRQQVVAASVRSSSPRNLPVPRFIAGEVNLSDMPDYVPVFSVFSLLPVGTPGLPPSFGWPFASPHHTRIHTQDAWWRREIRAWGGREGLNAERRLGRAIKLMAAQHQLFLDGQRVFFQAWSLYEGSRPFVPPYF